ncbi:MAG: response regulator [Acidobacteriia bacterium]|nr:response regulator [Terriglobia bacterium]
MGALPVILNVDDNEMCRYAVSRILERANFRVREAINGTEALSLARAEAPDLILLDLNLPDIDGFEVCRQLKTEQSTARIPVVHVSASCISAAERARGLEGGAESYLVEPVEPEVLIATVRAVLRARKAEEAANKMALEWQATFAAIHDGVAVVDFEGRIHRSNRNFAQLLGALSGELTGRLCSELWYEAGLGNSLPLLRAFKSRHREMSQVEHGAKSLSVTVDPMLDEGGAATGAVLIVSDITETRRLEEQFRESQKFETIGTLAAGVAHDYNNLLTSIMGNASLAMGVPLDRVLHDRLSEIMRASQRAADLTAQLLAYAGKGRHFLRRIQLSQVVSDTQKLIEAALPKKVRVAYELISNLPELEADSGQVQQVLMNLVNNAAEAIGDEAGCITIRTGATASGDRVFLEVEDTGCGMDEATKSRIFDPFFTTKFTGRGLGLAAVAGIARGHAGQIDVVSSPGQGSTFRLTLPSVGEIHKVPQPAEPAAPTRNMVLVVDDEEMVRRLAEAALTLQQFRVTLASNGLEAIQCVRQCPEIGVVVLDLTMPVMNGEEAIDEIMRVHPGINVILSTGYDQREILERFRHKPISGFLQKPYTARQLIERVRTALGSVAHTN